MPNGVSRETFQGYDTDSKLNTLFDYIHELHENYCIADKSLDKRVSTLEKRKRIDKAVAGSSGFIGGFLAVLIKNIFIK